MKYFIVFVFVLQGLFTTAQQNKMATSPWNMEELLQKPNTHPADSFSRDGYKAFFYEGIQYKARPTKVFAYYKTPAGNAPDGGWPAIVCVHGGGGTAFPEWIQAWVDRGYAAIAMDLEGHLPKGDFPNREWHADAGPARITTFGDIELADREQWFYHAVADVIRANSLLRSFPEINPQKIGIHGISWGAVITSAVMGLDNRFSFAVPVYGCGFLFESVAPNFEKYFKVMTEEQMTAYKTKWDGMPAGWKLGSNTSNGTTWLQGTNTVTITSDLSTGNGSTILIRAKNTCGANLANGQIPAQIVVSRLSGNVSMSAMPNSIPCGSTSPVTFTINNISSLSGITGYVWNLGSGNGWLYNGVSASSSISTSTNSITLTPVCGVKVSAPSASVTLNTSGNSCGITVPASTLNIAAPTLSIQGTQSLCAGTQNYSLTGMPCNASNIWSILPQSGVVYLNQTSGQSTSLTRVADGNITLAAKVTACGIEYPASSIPIHVGAYSGSYYSLNAFGGTSGQPLAVCPNQTYNFYVSSSMPLSNSIWTTPNGWTLLTGNGSSSAYIKTPASVGGGVVSVSFADVCGTPITLSKSVYYNSYMCNLTTLYTISPNPVTSNITISAGNLDPSYHISQVEITDLYGQRRLIKTWYPYKYQQVTIDASSLYPAGNYIVRIYTGTQWFNKQFIKQ